MEKDSDENMKKDHNEKERKEKLEIILEENNCNLSDEINNQSKDKEKKYSSSSQNFNSEKKINNNKYSPNNLFNEQNIEKRIKSDEYLLKDNIKNNSDVDNIKNTEKIQYNNPINNKDNESKLKNNSLDLIGYNLIQNQIKILNDNEQINEANNENEYNEDNIKIDNEYTKNENNKNFLNYLSDENKIVSDNYDSNFNIINNQSENENCNINNTPQKKNQKENLKKNEDNENDEENQINVLYSYEGYVNIDNDNEGIKDIEGNKDNNMTSNLNEEFFVMEKESINLINNSKNDEIKDNLNEENEKNNEKEGENNELDKNLKDYNMNQNNKEIENQKNEEKLNNLDENNSGKKSENNKSNKKENEEVSFDNKNKLNISIKSKENKEEENNINKKNEKENEKEKQSSSKKGALKILELLMSKKKEKEEIDKKKEEIMIETFQRARSKNLINADFVSENNKIIYNEINNDKIKNDAKVNNEAIDKENKLDDNKDNKNDIEEQNENEMNMEETSFKEKIKKLDLNDKNNKDEKNENDKDKDVINNEIKKENINEEKRELNNEEKNLINNEFLEKEKKNNEEIIMNLNNEKNELDINNNKSKNNLKISIINPNRIYKKNSRKKIINANTEKTNENNLYNSNTFSKIKKDDNSKNFLPTVSYKYTKNNINSHRNNYKKDKLELKKISNTIDNIPKPKNDNKEKKEENNQKKSLTPINNINQNEKEKILKNKKSSKADINNQNNEEKYSMLMMLNKNIGQLESSFDSSNIYKKRKLIQKDFSHSPSGRIYAPKRVLSQRGNSLGRLNSNSNAVINKSNININNVNYINNINTIIKNKNDDSLISLAYAKKSPIQKKKKSNIIKLNNNINNNINYINDEYNQFDNNIYKRGGNQNYDRNNNNINNNNYNIVNNYNYNNIMNNNNKKPKKKYLLTSKTSSMLKKRNPINKYENMDLSSDNINYNQKRNILKRNNYMNYNITNDKSFENNFYNNKTNRINRNNSNNNITNYPQMKKRKNQVIPSIYQNKQNNSLSQRYFIYSNFNNRNIENNYYTNNNIINNDKGNKFNSYLNNNYEDFENDNENFGNYYMDNVNKNKKQNSSISINIEDLMVLEEKLSEIIFFLKNRKEVKNQCFDFWNYFYNCSLFQRIEKTFKTEQNIEIVKFSINLELLSVMLCYEFSFEPKIINKTFILLLEILELNHRNLMIICENILDKICPENQKNRWVIKLSKIVQNSKMDEQNNFDHLSYAEKIEINSDKINKKLLNILLYYKTEYSPLIMSLMKKINQKNYEEINDFFREYILKVENLESSIVASVLLKSNPNFTSHRPPYLHSPRNKPYTLILDLNETLVSFQQTNYSQGILRLRPFLIEFLDEISYYYELILFTASTEYFAKPIINAIEENKKYFDFIFYRECCIIIGNDFVKDLTRIGRPLDSTIIVDNMQQNFRLQKENGIYIKPFFAQDPNDSVLYDLLNILIDIAEEEGDVREGLAKYRNDIVKKVTSNISKYNI